LVTLRRVLLSNRLIALAVSLSFASLLSAQSPAQLEFFEKRIRPILAANCATCHNAKGPTAGLDLATTDGIRYAVQYGGEAGKLVSADKPEESLLLQAIEYSGRLKMPPGGKLKDEQLEDMRAWVQGGTPVPGADQSVKIRPGSPSAPAAAPNAPAARTTREFTEAEKSFWAFQ
jgi:mono/diheme cytochrome c family protein